MASRSKEFLGRPRPRLKTGVGERTSESDEEDEVDDNSTSQDIMETARQQQRVKDANTNRNTSGCQLATRGTNETLGAKNATMRDS